ncbi:MAG: hypothetical protein DI533_17725 [Cereibacter sphaeroides]|uniref:Uncharacterized protein n=1 Tax=Cereibacter sphaeroides TaxID=1063 RepID=A0A2W5S2L2_CERSP|nr:MAG: hypothetical protein DI533_17725 [Cereibacter sphaeroides]
MRAEMRRNPRLCISDADLGAVKALVDARRGRLELLQKSLQDDRKLRLSRASAAAIRDAMAVAIPDFKKRAKDLVARQKHEVEGLRTMDGDFPGGWEIPQDSSLIDWVTVDLDYKTIKDWLDFQRRLKAGFEHYIPRDPPFAGELWWGETNWFSTTGNLFADGNNTPWRIWGHFGYDGDPLVGGSLGCSGFFFLTPDRFYVNGKGNFEIRPRIQTNGWVSGWTGSYHPVWAADDKWSKLWEIKRVTASLSTGEILATEELALNLINLDDEMPVGQASASVIGGWVPILRFSADMDDLRSRGISIILEMSIRYDFQLEGESDLWLRNRPGSASESVPAFDNAILVNPFPGAVIKV